MSDVGKTALVASVLVLVACSSRESSETPSATAPSPSGEPAAAAPPATRTVSEVIDSPQFCQDVLPAAPLTRIVGAPVRPAKDVWSALVASKTLSPAEQAKIAETRIAMPAPADEPNEAECQYSVEGYGLLGVTVVCGTFRGTRDDYLDGYGDDPGTTETATGFRTCGERGCTTADYVDDPPCSVFTMLHRSDAATIDELSRHVFTEFRAAVRGVARDTPP